MGNIFEEMELAIIDGDEELCASLAQKAIDEGIDPGEAIDKGFAKGMRVLGDRFESGECFLPELLTAEDAMNAAMEILQPKIQESQAQKEKRGKVVIGTIQGDVHDIGKNIVKLFMSVAGFEVIDVGRDVPVRTFIQTAQKENADIIAASALMTTTMVYMPELIKQLKELGIRQQFKVMVGGAPVIKSWALEVGSDGYGLTAKEAVQNALELMA
ncbi:MAG: dimethylamine corrinoid protein 3 [bacterium]|nr:dimethylamine corrinoid protein 3 [bacterium]